MSAPTQRIVLELGAYDEPIIHETLIEAMHTDEEDWRRQSARLLWDYVEATPAQREAVDNAFICLCGWSLETLIERTLPRLDNDAEEDAEEDDDA